MKKIYTMIFVFICIFAIGLQRVSADSLTAPIVSIGSGNGNSPENLGPVSGSSINGDVLVYATITDSDLDNYHFRVVKDGGIDGYTCTNPGALFEGSNQGYASTTLLKDACGFVFNQSVYVSPSGFANTLIATLNTKDIIAFSGEGDYWLILGAVDTAGNRTNSNYLNDARIKITVTNAPVVVDVPEPAPVVSGGGGGNGPIVNSYGVAPSGYSPAVSANNKILTEEIPKNTTFSEGVESNNPIILADGGMPLEETMDLGSTTSVNTDVEESSSSNQVAQVVSSGFNWNWLWLLLILVIGGAVYYFSRNRN